MTPAFLVKNWRMIAAGAAVVAVALAVWKYGSVRYNAGVKDTTARFIEADREGAKNVNQTAREALDSIGDDTDPDELLDRTGGLRDD